MDRYRLVRFLSSRGGKRPYGAGGQPFEIHTRMFDEIDWRFRATGPSDIGRTSAYDAANGTHVSGDQVTVWQMPNSHSDVNTIVNQVQCSVGEYQPDVNLRKRGKKVVNDWQQV
jgi:hypothetical protein